MNEKQVVRKLDLMSKKTDAQLANVHRTARDNIKKELAWYYEKYADSDGILTYNEMSKYNRLVNLEKFLAEEMRKLGRSVDYEIKYLTQESYQAGYYDYGQVLNDQYGANISFGQIRQEDLRSLINDPNVSGTSLRETLSIARYNDLLVERQAIIQGLLTGETYTQMAKRVQKASEKSFNDSLRIARTEAHRASMEGQMAMYDDAEEQGIEIIKTWVARHRNTRGTHLTLDGKHPDYEGYWYSSGGKTRYPGGFGIASEDINCVPGFVHVRSGSNIEKLYRHEYTGKLYTLTTSGGDKITGTANHPILTNTGWVPFGSIKKGDRLICAPLNAKIFSGRGPKIYNGPSTIAEIFNFFNIGRSSNRVLCSTKDFHGDGSDGYVDIIDIDGVLMDRRYSAFAKFFDKVPFPFSYLRKGFLKSFRPFYFTMFRLLAASKRKMSISGYSFLFFFRDRIHSKLRSFFHAALNKSSLIKSDGDTSPADSDILRNLQNSFTLDVFTDDVVDIEINFFHGDVYNLQTKSNRYWAIDTVAVNKGFVKCFILHNCHCYVSAALKKD